MKLIELVLILFLTITFLITIDSVFAMPNPSTAYCEEMGYNYTVVKTQIGDKGICTFPDGTQCEAWEFLEGKCGKEYSYCVKHGYDIETISDGNNSFSPEYAVCVVKQYSSPKLSALSVPSASSPVEEKIAVTDLMNFTETLTNYSFTVPVSERKLTSSAMTSSSPASSSLPSSFDWSNLNGSDWITPIKDQGMCGSCWAFATTSVVEAKSKIVSKDPKFDVDLSEQDVVSCSGAGTCCGGGWYSLNYARDTGLVDEPCFPYADYFCDCMIFKCKDLTTCSNKCSTSDKRTWKIDNYQQIDPTNEQAIKKYLIEKGPIMTFINLGLGYWDLNGVYHCFSNDTVNHVVALVGYNDDGKYWIIKNSWGYWLSIGFTKVGYGECSISPYFYVDLSENFKRVNASSIVVAKGDTTGTLKDTNNIDSNYLSLGEDCSFVSCSGLDSNILFPLTSLSNVSSITLVADHQGRADSDFTMSIWNGNQWKNYGNLPSSWNIMKYKVCSSPNECSSYLNNGTLYVNYNHPSCTICSKSYADIDLLYLEVKQMPKITIVSPINNKIYNSSTVLLNVSTEETSKLIKVSVDNGPNITYFDQNSALYYFYSLADGTHSITVYASNYDGNENSNRVDFIVDTKPPQKLYFGIDDTNPKPNQNIKFGGKWIDNYNLSNYVFGWNESGHWTYDTPIMFKSNPDWSNITKYISANDEGKTISYGLRVWDSAYNSNYESGTIKVQGEPQNESYTSSIEIHSPKNVTYDRKNILVNVSVTNNSKYIYTSLNGERFSKKCSDCNSTSYTDYAIEGSNNLTVSAINYDNSSINQSVSFFVDTIKPTVIETDPKNNEYEKGIVNFTIRYTENYLKNISIFYGTNTLQEFVMKNCPSGRNQECSSEIDLSSYDGKKVQYFFVIRDQTHAINSRNSTIFVDNTIPIINITTPESEIYNITSLLLEINVSEKVALKSSIDGSNFRSLCSNCNYYKSRTSFSQGLHNLTIKATDKSGNEAYSSVIFWTGKRVYTLTVRPINGVTIYSSSASSGYSTTGGLNGLEISEVLSTGFYGKAYLLFNSTPNVNTFDGIFTWIGSYDKTTGRIIQTTTPFRPLNGNSLFQFMIPCGEGTMCVLNASFSSSTLISNMGIYNSTERQVVMSYDNKTTAMKNVVPQVILGSKATKAEATDIQAAIEGKLTNIGLNSYDAITDLGIVSSPRTNANVDKVVLKIPF